MEQNYNHFLTKYKVRRIKGQTYIRFDDMKDYLTKNQYKDFLIFMSGKKCPKHRKGWYVDDVEQFLDY